MASEIFRERTYGNFKPTGIRKKHKSTWRDERPGMSVDHCGLIRQCPCAMCLRVPAGTIHHLKSHTGERGIGVRSTDQWGVPLCLFCHDSIEKAGTRNEIARFNEVHIDPHELAKALWRASGNLPLMTRLVIEHRHGG